MYFSPEDAFTQADGFYFAAALTPYNDIKELEEDPTLATLSFASLDWWQDEDGKVQHTYVDGLSMMDCTTGRSD
jgi:hypothetical protein